MGSLLKKKSSKFLARFRDEPPQEPLPSAPISQLQEQSEDARSSCSDTEWVALEDTLQTVDTNYSRPPTRDGTEYQPFNRSDSPWTVHSSGLLQLSESDKIPPKLPPAVQGVEYGVTKPVVLPGSSLVQPGDMVPMLDFLREPPQDSPKLLTTKDKLGWKKTQTKAMMKNPKVDPEFAHLPQGLDHRIDQNKKGPKPGNLDPTRKATPKKLEIPAIFQEPRKNPNPEPPLAHPAKILPLPDKPAPGRRAPPILARKGLKREPSLDDWGNPAGGEIAAFTETQEERDERLKAADKVRLRRKASDRYLSLTGQSQINDPKIGRPPPLSDRITSQPLRLTAAGEKVLKEQQAEKAAKAEASQDVHSAPKPKGRQASNEPTPRRPPEPTSSVALLTDIQPPFSQKTLRTVTSDAQFGLSDRGPTQSRRVPSKAQAGQATSTLKQARKVTSDAQLGSSYRPLLSSRRVPSEAQSGASQRSPPLPTRVASEGQSGGPSKTPSRLGRVAASTRQDTPYKAPPLSRSAVPVAHPVQSRNNSDESVPKAPNLSNVRVRRATETSAARTAQPAKAIQSITSPIPADDNPLRATEPKKLLEPEKGPATDPLPKKGERYTAWDSVLLANRIPVVILPTPPQPNRPPPPPPVQTTESPKPPENSQTSEDDFNRENPLHISGIEIKPPKRLIPGWKRGVGAKETASKPKESSDSDSCYSDTLPSEDEQRMFDVQRSLTKNSEHFARLYQGDVDEAYEEISKLSLSDAQSEPPAPQFPQPAPGGRSPFDDADDERRRAWEDTAKTLTGEDRDRYRESFNIEKLVTLLPHLANKEASPTLSDTPRRVGAMSSPQNIGGGEAFGQAVSDAQHYPWGDFNEPYSRPKPLRIGGEASKQSCSWYDPVDHRSVGQDTIDDYYQPDPFPRPETRREARNDTIRPEPLRYPSSGDEMDGPLPALPAPLHYYPNNYGEPVHQALPSRSPRRRMNAGDRSALPSRSPHRRHRAEERPGILPGSPSRRRHAHGRSGIPLRSPSRRHHTRDRSVLRSPRRRQEDSGHLQQRGPVGRQQAGDSEQDGPMGTAGFRLNGPRANQVQPPLLRLASCQATAVPATVFAPPPLTPTDCAPPAVSYNSTRLFSPSSPPPQRPLPPLPVRPLPLPPVPPEPEPEPPKLQGKKLWASLSFLGVSLTVSEVYPAKMDKLQVRQSEFSSVKTKAVEDARQMQATVIEAASKAGKDPPKYALLELIGKGSFGRVYKGKDMTSAAIVAVKIIDIDESDTLNPRLADSYSEFLKEVNALKILSESNAKNINHVIEALPVGQSMWMITEHCGGGSIATLMEPTAPGGLQEKWIIPILREVAEAIKWVHQAGIIHRDIKCANVLITEQGGLQLCDFGVAGIIENKLDKRSTVIGTPHWMAPELFDATPSYGKEVDIWAFGSMVYEIATGLPPNVAHGLSFERLGSHLKQHVPRLEGGSYSDNLRNLVAYCLEELPSQRPTIEQVQRHPYIYNTSSQYPASSLSNLVRAFKMWEDHGGSRKSLFMLGGAQGPSESSSSGPDDEWNFSTTAAFDQEVARQSTPADVFEAYGGGVKNFFSDETSRPQKPSRRRPPPEALARMPAPLEKIFDPNTLSNYEDNSRNHYGRVMQPPASDLPLRDDTAQTSIRDTMIDLGGHDSDTGISNFPDMDTIKANRRGGREEAEDEYVSTLHDFSRPALSDPADVNPNRRTQDWKFPSMAPPASADPELSRFPTSYDLPRPSITPGSGGRPALVHHPTEPIGAPFAGSLLNTQQATMERLSMRESLIDLDMSMPDPIPSYTRPSTANSDTGSATSEQMTSGNPFELERHASLYAPLSSESTDITEPDYYITEESAVPARLRSNSNFRDIGEISDFSASDVESSQDPSIDGKYDTYSDSDMPPPPFPAQGPFPRPTKQPYTFAHFPELPPPPSQKAMSGLATQEEMKDEFVSLMGNMTKQLDAFRDVYSSAQILQRKGPTPQRRDKRDGAGGAPKGASYSG